MGRPISLVGIRRLIKLAISRGSGSRAAQPLMRSNLLSMLQTWHELEKRWRRSALSDFTRWCYLASLCNCLVPVKLCSPDVRTFLLMDKMQNFSDASEDEDDKVSDWSIKVFLIYVFCFPADYIFSVGHIWNGVIRSFISVYFISRLCHRGVYLALYPKV